MADCKVNHAGMDTSDLRLSEDLNCKTTPHKADFIDHGLYGEEASTICNYDHSTLSLSDEDYPESSFSWNGAIGCNVEDEQQDMHDEFISLTPSSDNADCLFAHWQYQHTPATSWETLNPGYDPPSPPTVSHSSLRQVKYRSEYENTLASQSALSSHGRHILNDEIFFQDPLAKSWADRQSKRFPCSPQPLSLGDHAHFGHTLDPPLPPIAIRPPRGTAEAKKKYDEDMFILECRKKGLSYKYIREKGGFTVAESTLRGRFRSLTKNRCERVRKPQWTATDVELLKQFVKPQIGETWDAEEVDTIQKLNACAVSWKDSGRYIYENGGSYNFGPWTCKKKWIEICGLAAE